MSIPDLVSHFFQTKGFMPHGMCLLWQPAILWTMIIGNTATAISYFIIPATLAYLVSKRNDMGFKWIFVLFAPFITLCGLTHVIDVITLWYPLYGVQAFLLAITGAVSFITIIALWNLIPTLIKIPSPWALEAMNAELTKSNIELEKNEILKSRLAAIVESTDDAIISCSLDDKITSWNDGAEKLFGYSESEVLNKRKDMLVPLDHRHEINIVHEKIDIGMAAHLLETERKHKCGKLIPVSVSHSPMKDIHGIIVGYCSIYRDITEWKKIQDMKNEFISLVSHELRTPLTSIQGSLTLLTEHDPDAFTGNTKKLLNIAANNSERLARLVNDILDIQKIESGNMEFRPEPVRIDLLIKDAITASKPYCDKFEVGVILQGQENMQVYADPGRLMQVLTNLISNAIKFSPAGENIVINMEPTVNNARISVVDKGPGIPDTFKTTIFKKFAQADLTTSRKHGGTGLGLSICKEIIERSNGTIYFTSSSNGTTFYFELPLHVNEPYSEKVTETNESTE